MQDVRDDKVAFLGLGLIAGSLAAALKEADWRGELLAWGPRATSLERGRELGFVDWFSLDLQEVVSKADIVVISAPPLATANLLPDVIALAIKASKPIITDIASIKGLIVDAAIPPYSRFVPGHPIAGSEHSGVDFAQPNLFSGREVILTPLDYTELDAIRKVETMWEIAGSRITHMTVSEHDETLAASSHIPHMLAYALTAMLAEDDLAPMNHGGGALRDMTRIAGSDPLMWRDIALANQMAILKAMDNFSEHFGSLRQIIAEMDSDALDRFFAECRSTRRNHDQILNPIMRSSGEKS